MKYGKGETHPSAKLTEIQVKEIRRLYEKGMKQTELAKAFNVHRSLIGFIVRREIWKEVV